MHGALSRGVAVIVNWVGKEVLINKVSKTPAR